MRTRNAIIVVWGIATVLVWAPATLAHVEGGQAAGFLTGLSHPWSGLDHVLAMIAVGIWGAQLGNPALWLLPVTFPMVMALGALMGLIGMPIPGVYSHSGNASKADGRSARFSST